MSTIVYQLNHNGEIKELATYSLPPKQALKNAFLQFVQKQMNTWKYKDIPINIHEEKYSYQVLYGDNCSLMVKKTPL